RDVEGEIRPPGQIIDERRLLRRYGEHGICGCVGVDLPRPLIQLAWLEPAAAIDAELVSHLAQEMEVDRVDDHAGLRRRPSQVRQELLRHMPEGNDGESEFARFTDLLDALDTDVRLDAELLERARIPFLIRRRSQAREGHLPASADEHLDQM